MAEGLPQSLGQHPPASVVIDSTVGTELTAEHRVYLGGRDLRRGAKAGAEVGATPVLLDSTDGASIAAAVDRLRKEVGVLNVLVINAGIAGDQRPPAEATLDDLRRCSRRMCSASPRC